MAAKGLSMGLQNATGQNTTNAMLKAAGTGAIFYGMEKGVSSVNGVSGNMMEQAQAALGAGLGSFGADYALPKTGIAIRAIAVGAVTAGVEYAIRRDMNSLWIFVLAGAGSYILSDSIATLVYSIQSGTEKPNSQTMALNFGGLASSAFDTGMAATTDVGM